MPLPKHPGCIICQHTHHAWGLCRTHYARLKRTGSTHRWTRHTSTRKPHLDGGDDQLVIAYIRRHHPEAKL